MAPKVQKSKEAKLKAAMAGGKGRKKKWSKGKVKEQLNNAIMFDKNTWDKLVKEIPKAKLITPAIVTERMKVNGALARQSIRVLEAQGLIERVGDRSAKMLIFTRKVTA
jgi:small subunit ribosomal protein S25e